MSARGSTPGRFGPPVMTWLLNTTTVWMVAAFLVAATLGVTTLAIFGLQGAGLALRITARWSFLLFWLAYVGSAMAALWGPRFAGLARHGRELGLAFASAHLVHVAIILLVGAGGGMIFFWAGVVCTYLLVLFSLPRLQDILRPRILRIFLSLMLNYIALVFAADFILGPLETGGFGKYPRTYLPFALMLVSGVILRITAFWYGKSRNLRQTIAA
jgi:hypothetical protein